jgi:hypothetical protein
MMASNGVLRRLQHLGRVIGHRRARWITVKIPTLLSSIEGSVDSKATVTPETRAAADELLRAIDVTDEDSIIEIRSFYWSSTNGASEPEEVPAPELCSIR